MTDVSLSFGAPGVQAAIAQVAVLKREVAQVGVAELKTASIRKKTSTDAVAQEGFVRRSINKTTRAIGAQIAALKARRAAGGGVSGQGVGQALGRIGGAAGGAINAGAEGLGIGGALGGIAIAAVAVGLALNGVAAASERASASAAKVVQVNEQIAAAGRSIVEGNQGKALGFGQAALQPFREIVSRLGRKGGIAEVERLRGLGVNDADKQLLNAIKSGAIERLGVKSVGQIIETGSRIGVQADFAKLAGLGPRAIDRLKDTGGINDAVFGLGQGGTQRALNNQDAFNLSDPLARRLNDIQNKQGAINTEIFKDFLGGSGGVALSKQLTELRNAEAVALGRVVKALDDELAVLAARSTAEFDWIRRIKEVGSLVGLSRSESQQAQDAADSRASIGTR